MPKRPTTHPEILAEIYRSAVLGHSGVDIHRMLRADPRFRDWKDLPALRTIQDHVRRVQAQDRSGPWSLATADPETAGLVLDALAAVIEKTEGRISTFTVDEARWIVTIRQARPDLPPWDAWFLARFYVVREDYGDPTDDLDVYVAFAPWRDEDARTRYVDATTAAHVPAALLFMHALLTTGEHHWLFEDGLVAAASGSLAWVAEGPPTFRRRPKKETGQ